MNRSGAMTGLVSAAVLFVVLFLSSSCYVVHERDQVVVMRFSKPVRMIVGDRAGDVAALTKEVADLGQGAVTVSRGPGLYFKIPFVDAPERFPDTLIEYDSEPEYIVTRDKKQLSLDNFARWRIENPLVFRVRLQTVPNALGRLDDIIYSIMREELGKNNFIEIVRTTKEFTDLVEKADADAPVQLGGPIMTEKLTHGREEIMNTVTKRVNEVARSQFGIVVVDVRIRRAELLPENLQAVFARMRAERERISKGYVSEGERQGSVIQAETDRDVKIMIAEAEEQAQKLRGEGDAGALKIIAEGFNSNPEFYKFVRGLEAIGKATPPNSEFVVGLNSSLYKMLAQP